MSPEVSPHLLTLCFIHSGFVTAALSENDSAETQVTAAPGDVALLPCYTGGVEAPTLTTWIKNGREIIRGGGSSAAPTPEGQRVVVLPDGSLNIASVVASDQGSYLCNATLRNNSTFRARVLLQVAGRFPVSARVLSYRFCRMQQVLQDS